MSKVNLIWSRQLAYAIGLIATDGNLSPDGRHINFTTKDLDLAEAFKDDLALSNKIGVKSRGNSHVKDYYVIQFGDKNFYEYLVKIGLTPRKASRMQHLRLPSGYFSAFLRGCIDGDGNIDILHHPQSKQLQLRVRLYAKNRAFLEWVHYKVKEKIDINGGWSCTGSGCSVLAFGKVDSIAILRYIYSDIDGMRFLQRKYDQAVRFLA